MVEVTLTKMIWDINKIDLIPFFITLLSCLLLGIEIGILIGVCVDVIFLLHTTARPNILIEKVSDSSMDYIKVTPTSAILFPSAEYVREKIMQSNENYGDFYKFVVVDCQRINKIDFTAAKCLAAFILDFKKNQKAVVFYRPKKSVGEIITNVTKGAAKVAETENNLFEILKEENLLMTVIANGEINCNDKDNSVSSTQL